MQEAAIQNIFIHVWSVLTSHKPTHTCTHKHRKIYIPPTLTAGLALNLAPQGHRAWPQTIILIAHRGRVVCPHSHPDSLCAENPTTENSGLRVSGGLRTAASVRCVSPKSILLSSLRLPRCMPPGTWEESSSDSDWCARNASDSEWEGKKRRYISAFICIYVPQDKCIFPLSCVTGCGRPVDDEVMEMLGGHTIVMLGGCYSGTAICWKGQLLGDDSPGPCLPPSCHPHTHTQHTHWPEYAHKVTHICTLEKKSELHFL